MSVYRPRIIASLCLLLAVSAVLACAVLLRPGPADAARNQQRQFFFGPVYFSSDQQLSFALSNTGTRPTPPATVVVSDLAGGAVLQTANLPSVAPGDGNGLGLELQVGRFVQVVVTFDRPTAAEGIPSPFTGALLVMEGIHSVVQEVLYPVR